MDAGLRLTDAQLFCLTPDDIEDLTLFDRMTNMEWEDRDNDPCYADFMRMMDQRPRQLSAAAEARLRAQGKETPAQYEARRQQVTEAKNRKRYEVAETREKREEDKELPPIKVVPREFRLEVARVRGEMSMTQKVLAQKVGVSVKIIQDFEAGKPNALLSKPIESKVRRLLHL